MRKFYRSTIAVAAAGVMALGLAACSSGGSAEEPNTSSSQTAEATPEPLASIPSLAGVDTQVTLDAGFLSAITGLGLTPGTLGGATLDAATGTLAFPITGGNVDYYDPAEDYRPYVQGEISHDGSGISLSAGGTVVELTDFVIDPGTSRLTGTVSANGEVVGEDVFIFNLDGTTLNPLAMDDAGNAVLEIAARYVGTPYVSGGTTPAGFDCSGFTSYVYAQLGITLPRTSSAQKAAGTIVSAADAQPGDLIWSPGHISIYAGGDQQIDAPRPGKSVQFRSIWQSNPVFIRIG